MKPGYTTAHTGHVLDNKVKDIYILVAKYEISNHIGHYSYSEKHYTDKTGSQDVGRWKPKGK